MSISEATMKTGPADSNSKRYLSRAELPTQNLIAIIDDHLTPRVVADIAWEALNMTLDAEGYHDPLALMRDRITRIVREGLVIRAS